MSKLRPMRELSAEEAEKVYESFVKMGELAHTIEFDVVRALKGLAAVAEELRDEDAANLLGTIGRIETTRAELFKTFSLAYRAIPLPSGGEGT